MQKIPAKFILMKHHHMKKYQLKTTLLREKNLRKLGKQIFKVVNGLSPKIMNEAFPSQRQRNNLRNNSTFRIPSFNVTLKGKGLYPILVQNY